MHALPRSRRRYGRHPGETRIVGACAISNRPVRLDECELNPLEEPAHEACLAERRKEEINKRKAALESK